MIDIPIRGRKQRFVPRQVLLDPASHAGKTYEFSGKLVTFPQIAEAFSQVLGKKVTYVPVTLEQNEQAVRSRNLPDWLTTHMLVVGKGTADGGFSRENTKPIVDIVGREPTTIKQFVEDFKALFA